MDLRIISILTTAGLLFTGCGNNRTQIVYRKAIHTEYGKQAGLSPAESKYVEKNCPFGMPKKLPPTDFGNTTIVAREGYVLEHSARDKIPLWVCEEVNQHQVSGSLRRPKPEPFAPEPKLTKGRRAELADYKRSKYDRGHQAPSADQTVDPRLQAETYFLSNMAPQRGELNQKIWKHLEENVREIAKTNGPIYVTTGPMFIDEAEDDAHTADGYVEHAIIGNGVAVPTHFFKVIMWKDVSGAWQGTGLVMRNQKSRFPKPYRLNDYVRSIQWIEARTGLNFNPDLPSPDIGRIERNLNPIWN